jgi:hypothetical protein
MTHFMYSLLNTYQRFEKTAVTQAHILEGQTQHDFEEMRTIEKEKIKRVKEFSQTQNTSRNWDMISAAANHITSAIPLIAGANLYFSEESKIPSYLLIGSGVANIANRVFRSNEIYDKISSWFTDQSDLQEVIASRLESGLQYASYVAAAAGGYLASVSGSVAGQLTNMAKSGMDIASYGIQFGQSFSEKQTKHILADIQNAESNIQQRFQSLHQTTKESERLTHTIADIVEALKSAIQSLYSRV